MAPPPKREASASEDNNDEVCKRIKSDNKSDKKKEVELETTKSSNNNNNNNNSVVTNDTNGAKKDEAEKDAKPQVDSKVTAPASGDEAKDTKTESEKNVDDTKEDLETSAQVNGENKAKTEEKQSETNGNKQADTKVTTTTSTSTSNKTTAAAAAVTVAEPPEPEEEPTGTLLICGGANWDMTGRKELPKTAKKPTQVDPAARSLWGPHKVCLDGSDKPLRVRGVFSGCNACHSVIVTDEGVAMTFGRNDKGQLGLGDTETRITPVVVEALKGIDVVAAACGRSHTLFLSSDGMVFACGDNKMGQCGTNQQSVHTLFTPSRIAFKENKPVVKMACGAEFSMIVDIEGKLYSFGHPEHGQLGHNSEGKYFTSGNKYAFHCEYAPRRIFTFIEKSREGHVTPVSDVSIVDIACGTNHTLAVDKKHRCFSWGFAGYHRLGHCDTKNELVPRSIKLFDAPSSTGRGASKVFAGATHSMALDLNGLLYFWGQNKSSGEATMYPKNVQDLCGWRIRAVSCANRSIFVLADESSVSWGPSPTYGELGYGEGRSKSSTIPQEVKTLEGVHVLDVACGFGHTLLIASDASPEDQSALASKFKNWP